MQGDVSTQKKSSTDFEVLRTTAAISFESLVECASVYTDMKVGWSGGHGGGELCMPGRCHVHISVAGAASQRMGGGRWIGV